MRESKTPNRKLKRVLNSMPIVVRLLHINDAQQQQNGDEKTMKDFLCFLSFFLYSLQYLNDAETRGNGKENVVKSFSFLFCCFFCSKMQSHSLAFNSFWIPNTICVFCFVCGYGKKRINPGMFLVEFIVFFYVKRREQKNTYSSIAPRTKQNKASYIYNHSNYVCTTYYF